MREIGSPRTLPTRSTIDLLRERDDVAAGDGAMSTWTTQHD
jgi:hypothetical protein